MMARNFFPSSISISSCGSGPGRASPATSNGAEKIRATAAVPARHADDRDDLGHRMRVRKSAVFRVASVTIPTSACMNGASIGVVEKTAPRQEQPPHFGAQIEDDDPATTTPIDAVVGRIADAQRNRAGLARFQAAPRRQMVGVDLTAGPHNLAVVLFPGSGPKTSHRFPSKGWFVDCTRTTQKIARLRKAIPGVLCIRGGRRGSGDIGNLIIPDCRLPGQNISRATFPAQNIQDSSEILLDLAVPGNVLRGPKRT